MAGVAGGLLLSSDLLPSSVLVSALFGNVNRRAGDDGQGVPKVLPLTLSSPLAPISHHLPPYREKGDPTILKISPPDPLDPQ